MRPGCSRSAPWLSTLDVAPPPPRLCDRRRAWAGAEFERGVLVLVEVLLQELLLLQEEQGQQPPRAGLGLMWPFPRCTLASSSSSRCTGLQIESGCSSSLFSSSQPGWMWRFPPREPAGHILLARCPAPLASFFPLLNHQHGLDGRYRGDWYCCWQRSPCSCTRCRRADVGGAEPGRRRR